MYPKKFLTFLNGSNDDCHFLIKELAEEFKPFTCLGENTEKYIPSTVAIEKEVARIDTNGEVVAKNISSILQLLIAQDLWQGHYQI